jgi:hypothetical protein
MRFRQISGLLLVAIPAQIALAATDQLCAPMRAFVESVRPRETRSLSFHTSWGNFKDSSDAVILAKRCIHGDYDEAKKVCSVLNQHGAVEFAESNLWSTIRCLAPDGRLAPGAGLGASFLTFEFEGSNGSRNVTIEFGEDKKIGGMLLHLSVIGK